MSKPLKGFITYSHEDTEAKKELRKRLAVMAQQNELVTWDDGQLTPGDKALQEDILKKVEDSDLLLYLVSAASLASKNCNKELAEALNQKIRVIPIILEHCDWLRHQLSSFEVLPYKGKPITDWKPTAKGWQNVVEGIRSAAAEIKDQVKTSSNTSDKELRAELALQKGNTQFVLRQIDSAIAEYSEAIKLDPHFAGAYNNRGAAYAEKGEIDRALIDYDEAVKLNPESANAYANRGDVYRIKGDVDRAIEDCTTAINLDSECPVAYHNRGFAYVEKEKIDLAIEDYNKAIKLGFIHDSDLAKVYYNLGIAYRKKDDLDIAIEKYTKAAQLKRDFVEVYDRRSEVYHMKGEFDLSIADCTMAIQLDPESAEHYYNRGIAYNSKGDFDRAIKDYTKVTELDPTDAQAYGKRGFTYVCKNQFERAIEDFNKAIELNPDFTDAYTNRGATYGNIGNFDKALEDLSKVIQLEPDHDLNYYNRGTLYGLKGEFERAIEDFNKSIGLNPSDANTYNNRGKAYGSKGEFNLAIEDYDTAIRLNPQLAPAYYNRGEVWLHQKEWDKAKADFTTAKRLGVDITAMFHNSYKDVETYQKNRLVKLPEDLALLLTQRRRDRYPKLQKVLDADGNPLESPDVVNLREQLRNAGPPLSEYINAKSAFGVNTAPTEVFVVDKTTRDELISAHPASADILKLFLHGQDIRRWHVETPQQWLIFTHRCIAIDDYPAILKYLENHKESLQKRKGKQAWYELPASLEHPERFAQPKLVCPNIYNHHTFAVDTQGFYYGNTSYLIPTEEKWLCGLLNSRTVEWFYSQVSNQLTIDPLRARSGYIQQIPIPDITPVHKATIAKIVDYLISLQQQPEINSEDLKYARDHVMFGYFERVIDGLVYEAYLPVELHKSDKVFLQPLLDEGLPSIEEIQGDKMSAFRDIFDLLYDRMHLVRRHLYYLDVIKPIRIIQGKL